jgi:hypothetical protein
MAITVKIGKSEPERLTPKQIIELQVGKSLNNDLMIFDHADIIIVISPKTKKITAFPKDTMSDYVYGAQNRLFHFLFKKGIIDPASVNGGSVYGSLEAMFYDSDKYNVIKMLLLNISNYIDDERPYFEFAENYEELVDGMYTDPENEESTELGEIPHGTKKGSLSPSSYAYGNSFYYQSFTYE